MRASTSNGDEPAAGPGGAGGLPSASRNATIAGDVIDALDGLFAIEHRSSILDGSMPHRAARVCLPFMEGNAAGMQLRPAEAAILRVDGDTASIELGPAAHERAIEGYDEALEALVRLDLIERRGFWHRRLAAGFSWQRGPILSLWTGLLVRPAPGLWLLQTDARNRRSRIDAREVVITDTDRYVPVVLELDLRTRDHDEIWLDSEVTTLIPIRPDVTMTIASLEDEPGAAQPLVDFYTPEYLAKRATSANTGRYARLTANAAATPAARGRASCRLVVAGGANVHRVRRFRRFATAGGVASTTDGPSLEYAVLGFHCDVSGRWDGDHVRDGQPQTAPGADQLVQRLRALYGDDGAARIDWLADYIGDDSGRRLRGDPHLALGPWAMASTPPGWVSLLDAVHHHPHIDGLRAVVATDRYPAVPQVLQFREPCSFHFRRGAPLARMLPVPRELLSATLRVTDASADGAG